MVLIASGLEWLGPPIPDSLGSIVAALDSGTGAAFSAAGYSPYGENTAVTTGSFRYTAQRHDGETAGSASQPSGLYYDRARMYSPALGRFLQTDPAGPDGSAVNLYAYVDNDPLNATDPSGKCGPLLPVCIWIGETIVDTAPIWVPVVTKAVVGFGLGYYGAKIGGVQSTEGQVASGVVGAFAVPGTSSLIQTAARAGYAGWATFGIGAAGSFVGGSSSNIAGQYGDVRAGYSSQVDLEQSLRAGVVTTAAFTGFGEGALAGAAIEVPGGAGAIIDTITGTGSLLGGFGLDKLLGGQSHAK
ncbi:MAG: RHS repeat-associated core domain-containing protein [Rhizomicrobium sp.]